MYCIGTPFGRKAKMNIIGITISFLFLVSVAFGFQPEQDFLENNNDGWNGQSYRYTG
jgi:hypothetical protein